MTPPRRCTALATALLLTAAAPGGGLWAAASTPTAPVSPADPAATLKDTEQELDQRRQQQRQLEERARQLEDERRWLSGQLVALADAAQQRENELGGIEDRLARLAADEAVKVRDLDAGRARIAALLAALQRLARIPPEAALIRPDTPADALRAALLLRDMTPALRAEAATVADALARLAAVREELEAARREALAARQDIAGRQQQITQLAARREALARQTDAERQAVEQRMTRLAAQSGDLRQLMERIEQERRAAEKKTGDRKESERKAAEAEAAKREGNKPSESQVASLGGGGLRRPAAGKLAARFGQSDRQGGESRGVTIAGRPGAAVVAPYSGVIMYAGPFRNFGLILIVEHGGGYHSLLAGLGRIDVGVGRRVAAGEPLGVLPDSPEPDVSGADSRDLYFELRSNGRPVDPERGIVDKQGKGHG